MSTSVKMTIHDKQRLDRLQGQIMFHQGRRIPQQELLSWLLDLGEAAESDFSHESTRPMNKREKAAMHGLRVRTGVVTREEEIDAVIAKQAR